MVALVRAAIDWLTRAGTGGAWLLGSGEDVGQTYHPEWSLSTLARFPWVWTCVRAVSDDAGQLPLIAVEIQPDGTRRQVQDPALLLLERPSTGITGSHLRRQLWVDYLLTGNAYAWRPSPLELIRLHPARMAARTAGIGHQIVEYHYRDDDGTLHTIPPAAILHIRDVSWETGPASALGESAIRCLHDDLTMELGVKRLAAKQAQRGRPDVIFTSDKGIDPKDQEQLDKRWEAAAKNGRLAFTVGRDLKVQQLSWSPREFEFASRSEQIRDTVLAVFGVPPARAGLASANYGTQKQQMRTYWETVRARARAFDDAFSTLAQPGVRIEHDFTDVEALQISFTEAQQRVVTWAALGADPNEAAAYEGFVAAPAMDPDHAAGVKPSNGPSKKPEEPQGDKIQPVADYLRASVERYRAIAQALEEGADVAILRQWEVERAIGALESVADPDTARQYAERIVGATIEAVRLAVRDGYDLATLRAFTTDRAARIVASLEAA
jgi:HK97 family phage portal protein